MRALLTYPLFVIAFLFGWMLGSMAWGHSWYPYECCSEKDCEPMTATDLKRNDEGWILPNGQVVPFDNARVSPDHAFHWCRHAYEDPMRPIINEYKDGKAIPCFWAPTGGV